MEKSKLFVLLNTFSKDEKSRFSDFLKSAYFKSPKIIEELFQIINSLLEKKEKEITPEEVFQKLLKGKKFNYKLLSNYTTTLLRQAERFLVLEQLEQQDNLTQRLLLTELSERKLERHFNSHLKKRNTAHKKGKLSLDRFFDEYQIQSISHEFNQKNNRGPDKKIFENILDSLDSYLILKKLILACEGISYQKVYNFSVGTRFLDEMNAIVTVAPFKHNELIQLHYLAYKLYKSEQNDEVFELFRQKIIEHQAQLESKELDELLTIAVNYSNRQLSAGRSQFFLISLSIYEIMKVHKILFQAGVNKFTRFSNAIAAACRLGNFEWAKKFIDNSIKDIDKAYRVSAKEFGYGILYFYEKKFTEATDCFDQAYNLSDTITFYGINHRYMYMRSRYESDQCFDGHSVAQFNLFKDWTKKTKRNISKRFRNAYFHSMSILTKLYRVKYLQLDNKYNTLTKRRNQLRKIEVELNNYPLIMAKEWYLEKIKELYE